MMLIALVAAADIVRIGFYQGNGTSSPHENAPFYSTLQVAAAEAFTNFSIQNMSESDVANLLPFSNTSENYDIVVFPGGSGGGQADAIGDQGLQAIRDFVRAGGGYIGTCGGAFLGLQHVRFYGFGPAGKGPPTQEPWNRGHGPVRVEFTSDGVRTLHLDAARFSGRNVTIEYWQGPIVKDKDLPRNVSRLAWFRSEIHSHFPNQTTGEMVNTPALTALDGYGRGRVCLNSPHPELSPTIPEIYVGELRWVLRRE